MMDRLQMAEQMRRALQMFAASLTDEEAMEVATVYDAWEVDKQYKLDDLLLYGKNAVGDPQLYRVISAHKSQADWAPDVAVSLYKAIGLDDKGHAVWAQPTGAHDAYNVGDVVNHNGDLYESLIPGNCTVPGTDERYWKKLN